jgi:hypothetical protein
MASPAALGAFAAALASPRGTPKAGAGGENKENTANGATELSSGSVRGPGSRRCGRLPVAPHTRRAHFHSLPVCAPPQILKRTHSALLADCSNTAPLAASDPALLPQGGRLKRTRQSLGRRVSFAPAGTLVEMRHFEPVRNIHSTPSLADCSCRAHSYALLPRRRSRGTRRLPPTRMWVASQTERRRRLVRSPR